MATRDPASFDAVYRAFVPVVLRHLQAGFGFKGADGKRGFYRVQSAFDAEEICHDAFAIFFKQCLNGGFDVSRPVRPYLLRIVSHEALRRGRKQAREVLIDEPLLEGEVEPEDRELRGLLDECYSGLSEEDQAVFDACFVDGLSQAQAGKRLGRSRDQVYRSLTRVKKSVRGFFTERGWFG